MKVLLLTLIISVVIPSLAYEQPTCRAHEGTVLSFCNGSPFRKWGVGPEGEEQAIANCQWAANSQECIRNTTVVLDPFTLRSIGRGANATIDRMQWFGGHWNIYKSGIQWRDEDVELFHDRYHAHPGRSFYVSYRMSQCVEDSARPGFVDVSSLIASCANARQWSQLAWPLDAVDMIVSSKPDQLYPNSCGHRNGQAPNGFMPGSHAAAAEFFALYYQHCMPPTAQNRVFMEVSNECDVKTFPTACNSPWSEMVKLHAAVGDAIHNAYDNATALPRPIVCGPTEAFPEYQRKDFRTWRAGGQLSEFLAGTVRNSSIDCLSTHIYSTYQVTANATGRDSNTDPFSSNYVAREVNNVDAILDMQEAGMTAEGAAAAILISEYGAAFKDKLLYYHPAHDFWILRAVNTMLMTFLERPDRILKALPFIVDKATWHVQGSQNNASQSYPQAMWRKVSNEWQITHLHKFYGMWRDFGGKRFPARSDHAQVQVHAAVRHVAALANWTVAVNNADHLVPTRVHLAWPLLPTGATVVGVSVRRLAWDSVEEIPTMTDTHEEQSVLPTILLLAPAELALVTVHVEAAAAAVLAATKRINTLTFPSPQQLVPLPTTAAAANNVPFRFLGVLAGGATPLSVRVSLGGPAENRTAILMKLNIVVNGVACVVDPTQHIGGQQHKSPQLGSFFGGLEVLVPITAVTRGPRPGFDAIVKVWSNMAVDLEGDPVVVSTVALLVENTTTITTFTTSTELPTTTSPSVSKTTSTPAQPSISTTTSSSIISSTTSTSEPSSSSTASSSISTTTTSSSIISSTTSTPEPSRISTTTSIPKTSTPNPSSITPVPSSDAIITTSKGNVQNTTVVSVKDSNTLFLWIFIVIGVILVVVCCCGFLTLRGIDRRPDHIHKNLNSWKMLTPVEQSGSNAYRDGRGVELGTYHKS